MSHQIQRITNGSIARTDINNPKGKMKMSRQTTAKQATIIGLMLLLALLLAACGGKKKASASDAAPAAAGQQDVAVVQGDPAKGEQIFQTACVACHGPDATGVEGLGKSLHAGESEFVASQTDEQLVEFIKQGRQPGEPGNTTGVAMPPKGGNPALSDEDIHHIVAWLRTLE